MCSEVDIPTPVEVALSWLFEMLSDKAGPAVAARSLAQLGDGLEGEDREALGYMLDAMSIMHWQSVRWGLGTVFVRIATILADRDPEAASVLDGAGEALAPGFVHHHDTEVARARGVATTIALLGEARRAELDDRGSAMTEDEAVA